jgi:SAM-dependent methyltransferase
MAEDLTHRSGLSVDDYKALTGFDGDWRDTWWDDDFLAMMGRKWRLHEVRTALDVGAGVGHWGQRLLRHMDEAATLSGIDAEPTWVSAAQDRARSKGLEARTQYRVADAQVLPWEDDHFDLVTCQTLLMHVGDPAAVVREMVRVLRPGGLFVAAEPNNFGTSAGQLTGMPRMSWEDVSPLLELEYVCALGKEALGEGWFSVGEHLPATLVACGWSDVQVHQNSQSARKIPPYTDPTASTAIQIMREAHAAGTVAAVGGTPENVRRYFVAGGGDPSRLDSLWDHMRQHEARCLAAIDAGTFVSAGGHIHALVWGHKP